jgi:hypothetical protein
VRTIDAPTLPILSLKPRVSTPEGGSPEQVGRSVYAQHCESCHGADRNGVTSPNERGVERFKSAIRDGVGQMPGYSDTMITPQQLDSLMAYILNPAAGAPPRPRTGPPIPPPPAGQTRITPVHHVNAATGCRRSALLVRDCRYNPARHHHGAFRLGSPIAARRASGTPAAITRRETAGATAGGLLIAGTPMIARPHLRQRHQDPLGEGDRIGSRRHSDGEVGGRQYIAFAARTGPIFDNIGRLSSAWSPGKNEAQGYYVFALPR